MTDAEVASSVSISQQLRQRLLMQEELAAAEVVHAGTIAILSAGRYGARLNVNGVVLEFRLVEPEDADEYFELIQNHQFYLINDELLALSWHRAAEAILAVRQGHTEFNKRRKARKERD